MKPLLSRDIKRIVDGTLIRGSDDLLIQDAVYYLEMINRPNTVVFQRMKWKVNWSLIEKYTPIVVVTDKIVDELTLIENCTIILVENIETAFWKFVEFYRSQFLIPVISVTGSSGKSTTKDMIKHILGHSHKVHGTEKSANGRTVHFRYLLGIDDKVEAAVFETAVGQPGDITNACKFFKPIIGIITNIGIDHFAGCKTMDNYINAKAEMLTSIGSNGVLIINSDDENIKKINFNVFMGRVVTFGIHNPSNFQAKDIVYGKGGMNFTLSINNMKYPVFVPGYGEHQVYNALAAMAAVHELGIGIGEATEWLRSFKNLPLHLELVPGIGGCEILDDSWNTNPPSMKAAITVLNELANGRKKVALLGDMNDQGETSPEIHRYVGDIIVDNGGVDLLVTIGPLASEIANQIIKRGTKCEIYSYPNVEGVYELLKDKLDPSTILLVKYAGYHDQSLIDLKYKFKYPNKYNNQ